MQRLSPSELTRRSASELARLSMGGDFRAQRVLERRYLRGDLDAKAACHRVVAASNRGVKGAARSIRVCKRRTVKALDRSWEAGRLSGITRNTGDGPETPAGWLARSRRPSGHAPRRATNTRTAGSRRRSASRAASRGDPDGDDDPPGVDTPKSPEGDSGSGCTQCPRGHRLQPDLAATIRGALDGAGSGRYGFPQGFTHRELAQLVYGTDEPTVSQLSAVRRAGARLVDRGEATRSRRGADGVELRRPMTAADHEARAEALRPMRERAEAKRRATIYPVDSGYGGIQEVMVEPALRITEAGVELREVQV